jgi:serine/threonine-protein kinase ATR
MARRIPDVNGNAPPPSTLAAQVVQNHQQPPQQQNGDNALKHLLRQLLDSPDTAQETDIHVNVQLVHVVSEAGLAPLAQLDPFANRTDLLAEAKDSIAVIERTLKRQPEILFTPVAERGPQLGLLLFARLASVCGKIGVDDLSIVPLVESAVQAALASIELWKAAELLRQLCIDIIEGMW